MGLRATEAPRSASLPHALAATLWVVLGPLVVFFDVHYLADSPPSTGITALMIVGLPLLASSIGTAVWKGRPASMHANFAELMLWNWFRRRRAERRLAESTDLLGLDWDGRPLREPMITPAEQTKVLRELMISLEVKDDYTLGHTSRVERHAYNTAMALGLSVRETESVRTAAAVHDVGKVRIPDSILRNPGALSDAEWAVMKEHPVIGESMVQGLGDEQVVAAVRHHHERWDGRGYPDGIVGEEIPLPARIIAVADTFDAVTSTRSYRAGCSRQKAIEILEQEKGLQFQPEIVDAFVSTLPRRSPVVMALWALIPQSVYRSIMRWWQRVSLAPLPSALGAAGTAVFVGMSLFGGSFVAPGDATASVAGSSTKSGASSGRGADAASRWSDASVLGARIDARADRQAAERRNRREDRRKDRERNRDRDGDRDRNTPVASAPNTNGNGGGSSTSGGGSSSAPGGGSVAVPDTAPVGSANDSGTSNDSSGDPAAVLDPQDAGKDCDNIAKGVSKGEELHCGG